MGTRKWAAPVVNSCDLHALVTVLYVMTPLLTPHSGNVGRSQEREEEINIGDKECKYRKRRYPGREQVRSPGHLQLGNSSQVRRKEQGCSQGLGSLALTRLLESTRRTKHAGLSMQFSSLTNL